MGKLAVVLVVIGFLILFCLNLNFINLYLKYTLIMVSAILMAIGFFLLKKSISNDYDYINKKKDIRLQLVKYDKIVVDLNECEIVFYSVDETKPNKNKTMMSFYNSLFFENNNIYNDFRNYISIEFTTKLLQRQVTFISKKVTIDINVLKANLQNKKSTFLYVNRRNYKDYYFDVDFLNIN